MDTSTTNTDFFFENKLELNTSAVYSKKITISENNRKHIFTLKSFLNLQSNWDSYNSNKPSFIALTKSLSFVQRLSERGIEVFFVAPTSDGDIIIEIKNEAANLEFIFSEEVDDKIIASCKGIFNAEAELNETTYYAYLKWLICPHGNCPDFKRR